jgi:hypothetical protein
MTLILIQHELKALWRSKSAGKNVATRIVMGIAILYLFLCMLALGLFLNSILEKVFPKDDLLISFCSIILFYYLPDLFMRLQLQELPTLRVQPYLQLAVKRNSLARYLSFTALFSVFNLWPFVLFVPFIFKIVVTRSGSLAGLAFIVSLIGLTLFNNYFALYLKRKSNLKGGIFLIALVAIIVVGLSDIYLHLYSIRKVSYLFFGHLITNPSMALLPVLLGVAIYYSNFLYLKQNLYLDDFGSRKIAKYKNSTDYPFLSRFESAGDLAANEIKLVLRNKRPRSALIMGMFVLLYGLMIYANPVVKSEASMILGGMFVTGIFIINYGQFMYGWQASHFDGLMVNRISFAEFLKAKYLLFAIISTSIFLMTFPYVYFGWRILFINFVMLLWNIGVNIPLVFFFANRNYKRIDLSKSAAFNWEGVNGNQWILALPMFIAPFIIYTPLSLFGYPDIGLILLATTAIVFIFMRDFWIRKLEADFHSKKYKIAEGFRNK